MIFDVILLIILIIIVRGQSNRITNLEKKINNMVAEGYKSSVQATSSQVPPAPVATVQTPVSTIPVHQVGPSVQTPNAAMPSISQTEGPKIQEEVSGQLLGRIGIGAVIVGMAFFLKYAFDNNWIGPAGRVMVGVFLGIGLLVLGQYMRRKYLTYAELLMGGGVAVLYLSFFAAYSFYNLTDMFLTGVLMFLVTILAFVLSLRNEDTTLSMIAVVGGFATPFLLISPIDMMGTLFMYLTILNIGVLAISFFKKWPNVTVLALVGTAMNFIVWYMNHYTPDLLSPTLLFLTVSFIIFLIASVARLMILKTNAKEGDYFIIGLNALMYGFILYIILEPMHHNSIGLVAVLLGITYGIFSYFVHIWNPSDTALNIFLPGLTTVFFSVAIPIHLSGPWIATLWFVESCVLYYIASKMNNRGFQIMGIIVYILGGLNLFLWNIQTDMKTSFVPIFNSTFYIFVVAIIAAYLIAYFYKRYGSVTTGIQQTGITVYVVIANILTLFALSLQIYSYYNAIDMIAHTQYNYTNVDIQNTANITISILWAIYAAILTAIGFIRRISLIRKFGLILFVITAIKVVTDVWNLGQLYRIVSFIVFGIIALAASFAYVKYKDRLV